MPQTSYCGQRHLGFNFCTESYDLLLKVCKDSKLKRRGCADVIYDLTKQCTETVQTVLAVCLTLYVAWVRGVNSKDGVSLQAD